MAWTKNEEGEVVYVRNVTIQLSTGMLIFVEPGLSSKWLDTLRQRLNAVLEKEGRRAMTYGRASIMELEVRKEMETTKRELEDAKQSILDMAKDLSASSTSSVAKITAAPQVSEDTPEIQVNGSSVEVDENDDDVLMMAPGNVRTKTATKLKYHIKDYEYDQVTPSKQKTQETRKAGISKNGNVC